MGEFADAYERTVEANAELVAGLDDAVVAAGRALAVKVDQAVADGDSRPLYLVPHLMNVLREMYATPKARDDAGKAREVGDDPLASIRALRGRGNPSKKRAS